MMLTRDLKMKAQQNSKKSPIDVNKEMTELKKKIQLSEGQRKAAFEVCEAERKSNQDEIQKLKKEISDLVVNLKEARHATTFLKIFSKRLESLIGPFDGKSADEIQELVDLHIIDKCKLINLIQYKIKRRQTYLSDLVKEYQLLLSEKSLKDVTEKVDKPVQTATCDLQNNIHAVEVQLREANHISTRYKDIKKSLQEDAARFESTIKKIEDELQAQSGDINRLQQVVMDEATRMRGLARGQLLKEERVALSSANSREKQTFEGRRLVSSRRQDLELLEKRIFQSGKSPVRTENEEAAAGTDDELETPTSPEDVLTKVFDVLKKATGATSTEEVLERFSCQKDTQSRLLTLRQKSETEKKKLEKDLEVFRNRFEHNKFQEVKETERKSVEMEEIQNSIEEQQERLRNAVSMKLNKRHIFHKILSSLRELHLSIDPLAMPSDNVLLILSEIQKGLQEISDKMKEVIVEEKPMILVEEGVEEKWLPAPYSGLVRRTPLPHSGSSPAPPPPPAGSEDEEEVPSRAYLKRQAQLVVDAKSRRKNIRMQGIKRS